MSELSERKVRRVSGRQLDILFDFLQNNRDIVTSFNRSLQAKENSNKKWAEAASRLNSEGLGVEKSGKEWCKYWVDYKAKLKKKISALRRSQSGTGGGPSTEPFLSDIEKKFLSLLGEGFGQGIPGIQVDPFGTEIEEYTYTVCSTETTAPVLPTSQYTYTVCSMENTAPVVPTQTLIESEIAEQTISQSQPMPSDEPLHTRTSATQSFVEDAMSADAGEPVTPITVNSAGIIGPTRRPLRLSRNACRRSEARATISSNAARHSLIQSSERRANASEENLTLVKKISNTLEEIQRSLARIESLLDPRAKR